MTIHCSNWLTLAEQLSNSCTIVGILFIAFCLLFYRNRFCGGGYVDQLPAWLRPSVKNYPNFGTAMRDVLLFFKNAEKMASYCLLPNKKAHQLVGLGETLCFSSDCHNRPDSYQALNRWNIELGFKIATLAGEWEDHVQSGRHGFATYSQYSYPICS